MSKIDVVRKAMVEAILDRCPLKTEDWNTQRD